MEGHRNDDAQEEEENLAIALALSIQTAEQEEKERIRKDIELVNQVCEETRRKETTPGIHTTGKDVVIALKPPPVVTRRNRSPTPDVTASSAKDEDSQSEPPPEKWHPLRPPPPTRGRRNRPLTPDLFSHPTSSSSSSTGGTINQFSSLPRPSSATRLSYLDIERSRSPSPLTTVPITSHSPKLLTSASLRRPPPPPIPSLRPNAKSSSFKLPPPLPRNRPNVRTSHYNVISFSDNDKTTNLSIDTQSTDQPLIQLSPPPTERKSDEYDLSSFDPLSQDSTCSRLLDSRRSAPTPNVSNKLASYREMPNPPKSAGFALSKTNNSCMSDNLFMSDNPFDIFDSAFLLKTSQSAGSISSLSTRKQSDIVDTKSLQLLHGAESVDSTDNQQRMPLMSTSSEISVFSSTMDNNPWRNSQMSDDSEDLMAFSRTEMDFRKMEEEFLSLESFDPFYSISNSDSDTMQVFGGQDVSHQKTTPDPFPNLLSSPMVCRSVKSNSAVDKNRTETSIPLQLEPHYRHYSVLSLNDLETSDKSNWADKDHRTGNDVHSDTEDVPIYSTDNKDQYMELLDPFSATDLAIALEQRRKAKEESKKVEERSSVVMRQKTGGSDRKMIAKQNRQTAVIEKQMDPEFELLRETGEYEDEVTAFCHMVVRLKTQYKHGDKVSNRGIVFSSRILEIPVQKLEVKVIVDCKFAVEPIIFTCDVNTLVEHVIMQVLLTLTDDIGSTSTEDYIVKVHGLSEYLVNKSKLSDYEYVQNCLKLDQDIRLTLEDRSKVKPTLMRTAEDDRQPVFMPKKELDEKYTPKITKDTLNILMETYFSEAEKLSDRSVKADGPKLQIKSLIQAVKAICAMLCKIETIDILKAVERLQALTTEQGLVQAEKEDKDSFMYVTRDGEAAIPVKDNEKIRKTATFQDDLQGAIELLTSAVKDLVDMYCKAFHTDFRFNSRAMSTVERKEVTQVLENLIVHVGSVHRIPQKWKDSYEEYQVTCGIYYGGKKLCAEIVSHRAVFTATGFQDSVIWDEWMQFVDLSLCMVPRETRLLFTLTGYKTIPSSNNATETGTKVSHILGWVALPVFNFKHVLVKGSQLLGLWPDNKPDPTGTSMSDTVHPLSVLLQINMPDFDSEVYFPAVIDNGTNFAQDFESLHPKTQQDLEGILQRDTAAKLSQDDCEALWEKRYYMCSMPGALAHVLQAAHSWDWANLCDVYNVIREWKDPSPVQALELLLPRYADEHVRAKAVDWLRAIPSDELCDYLPQLIQTLKFENFHNSALARFLLERAATNLKVAHSLYWLLRDAADDVQFRKRYQLIFGALMSVVGAAMREELQREEEFVQKLATVAEKVKKAKDKDDMLVRELERIYDFISDAPLRLPFNPGIEVSGIDVKSCSYFTSFTFPLKLVLRNIDPRAVSVYTIFKAGDDLRQDMLTMQMVRLMDRLWRRNGLDLKIITFRCLPTGAKKGLIELITESETLRKIQMKYGHGVAGSFKDKTISDWLTGQNPSELEYKKAVDNFTASCAGYCVATYVLGICDRHNDNIMIKHSGHLFHIDFGKFLGDAQMFGNIKRDRVPFVLTSDMVYVINGGDKPSMQFQNFVDLCCQAFNIIRKHGDLLLTLFMLMIRSGVPGVTSSAVKYVQRALLPELSDGEATAAFTRMIEESMSARSTQINFFFHNLAQLKFTGHSEGALLSFIPKTYSIHTDGKISNIQIFGYQKRYNPEKYYIYIIKVERENQTVPTFIFRRYSEFYEFHHTLIMMFPLAKLPSLPGKIFFGRTHIKSVAETRKVELEKFLLQLLNMAAEISEHDIVYTFFHTMLRDEQDAGKTNLQKLREPKSPRQPFNLIIKGQVKLSLVYRNSALEILVMHVKELSGGQGSTSPDSYVKTYLLPDPSKITKRKTKIARGSFHPTFNEVLMYRMKLEEVKRRILQVSVWNYDRLKENESMGAVHLDLSELDLSKTTTKWYPLGPLHKVRL